MDDLVEALENDLNRIEKEIKELINALNDKTYIRADLIKQYLENTIRR